MKTPPKGNKTRTVQTRPTGGRKYLLPVAGLWIGTLLVYSSAFQGGLIFDSASRIVQDPRVHAASAANVDLIFKSDYWHPALGSGLYRPLTTVSFLFNYAVLGDGTRPFGYHLINWMLHAMNATLVYFLALRMLKEIVPAVAIAALWAVHPVLTESVTNVVGRADLLAGIGVLGGLLCYIRAMDESERRWVWLAGAALASGIGMFSKESAIIVLPIVFLYELAFGAAPRPARIAGYAALALPAAIYWIVRTQVFAGATPMVIPFTDNPIARAGFFPAKLTAIRVIGKEILLLLWPARLSCDYSYHQIPLSSTADWKAWAALVACLGLVAAAVAGYRRNRVVFFWIGFFFVALAPTANLAKTIGTPLAERFLYLPAIGFAGCVAAVVFGVLRGNRERQGGMVLAAIGLALAARTYARNFDWKDEKSLWSSAVTASPASYKTHMTLATVNAATALRENDLAISIVNAVPDEINTPVPFVNGGRIYREEGDKRSRVSAGAGREAYQKAVDLLLRADRIRHAHEERNRREGAASNATSSPVWAPLYQELGRVYGRLSQFDKAVEALRAALTLRQSQDLFEELSVAYFRMGDSRQAAIALLEGLVNDPQNQKLAAEVASLYQQTASTSCTTSMVNGQPALNLDCPMVHDQTCAAAANVARRYRESGQAAAANRTASSAVEGLKCSEQLFRP